MIGWTLVEPCCGSAALTLHLLGARRSLVPYQGTKWSLRMELDGIVRRLGYWGAPDHAILVDVAPWSAAIAAVLRQRDAVLAALRPLVERGTADPAGLYAELSGAPVPEGQAEMAATLLWLQRMNFASKAVGAVGGRWSTHGLNTTAAYGRAGTERFGAVRPLGPALLEAVELAPTARHVEAFIGYPLLDVTRPTLVYLDPPYQGTTPYPSGTLSRFGVVDAAREWAEQGASVIVSECEPIAELVADGWEAMELRGPGRTQSRQQFRMATRGSEWVTVWRTA